MIYLLLALPVAILLGYLPGLIAKRRGHQSATAIRVCGLVGILVWPAWFVAIIWAYTGPDNGTHGELDYHLGTHRRPAVTSDPPATDLPGLSRRERSRRAGR